MKFFVYAGMIGFSALFIFWCFSGEHYEHLANRITKKTAIKLEEEKNLYLVGTGGRMMDDIKGMHMSFDYYQEVDLDKARQLMVYVIDEYLHDINQDKEIKPYLHEYPFTAKNIEIEIWIRNSDGTFPNFLDKIYYFSAIDGNLDYYVKGEKQYSRKEICEETYEEAKLKLSEKRNTSVVTSIFGY